MSDLEWTRGDNATLRGSVGRDRDTIVTTNVVYLTAHGMAAATALTVVSFVGISGVAAGDTVYVVSPTTDSFSIAATAGGTAIALGTGTLRLDCPVNVTGAVLRFTAKYMTVDPDADAVVAKSSNFNGGITVTDAALGTYEVAILPADTVALAKNVKLAADVQLTENPGTAGELVTTVWSGSVSIVPDVTRTKP